MFYNLITFIKHCPKDDFIETLILISHFLNIHYPSEAHNIVLTFTKLKFKPVFELQHQDSPPSLGLLQ